MALLPPLPSWAVRITHILTTIYLIFCFRPSPTSAHTTIHVQPPQSIQSAISAARPFDTILVGPGTYAEQLLIQTNGLTLLSHGAILIPPPTPLPNVCSGLAGPNTQTGICVAGSGLTLAPFKQEHRKVLSVAHPVSHVTIRGFQIHNFTGANIALLGAQGSQILGNWLYDGQQYGALTAGSTDTLVGGNAVVSTSGVLPIGICTDNFAGATVSDNHVSGYFVGLCIQTDGAEVHANDGAGCCVGAYVDPRVRGAKLQHNRVSALNPLCDGLGGGAGVYLDGSLEAEVRWNLIEGMVAGGMGVGIIIVDDETVVPVAVAGGNVVEYNVLRGNDLDVFVNTTGVGNVVTLNDCDTPGGVCS